MTIDTVKASFYCGMRIWSHLLAIAVKRINKYWSIRSCPMAHYRITSIVLSLLRFINLSVLYFSVFNDHYFVL
jgi:hypothetical protein